MVALDGNGIATEGAEVEAERFDGPVHLPRCVFQAIVAANLDIVAADLLMGPDSGVKLAGVRLQYDEDQVLCGVHFGPEESLCAAGAAADVDKHLMRGVEVVCDGNDVVLKAADDEVCWLSVEGH